MKSRNLGIFAAVVAVVVGYALYDYKSGQNSEKAKSAMSLLIPFPVDQINGFSIVTANATIEMQKDKDGWKMLKPLEDAGDKTASDQFVEGLITERATETVMEGDSVNLANFGLDQPKGTIAVTNNLGQKIEIKIGSLKNFQGDAFLQKDQEKKVVIGSSTWFAKTEKKPVDFRDKRLMRQSNAKVEKISFDKGKEKFQLYKKDGVWTLNTHPDWKLDQNRVRELLTMLNATEVLEFIANNDAKPEELQKWGLKSPRLKLTVDVKDAEPWIGQFAAGNDKVHRVLVSQPHFVLKISPTDSDKFYQMTENYFRDRSEPFNFDKSQVQEIQIHSAGQNINLKATEDRAKILLSRISNLRLADFEEGKAPKLTEEIVLKGEKNDILKLQWGDLHKNVYFAKSSLYPHGFTIQETDIANLKLDELLKKESVK